MEPAERTLGPYAIEAEIGQGGMGSVYRARGPGGRLVALKTMRASLTTRDALARFAREARIRIDHPNIVRTVDAGVDADGRPYIAFELLEGRTLAQELRDQGPLTALRVAELGARLCAGIAAAHRAGIVHRDLKPSNVFLCASGEIKILDFGVSWIADGTGITSPTEVVGTLAYLAPEQAERRSEIDERCDIWAIGAVLYEALAGRPPFDEGAPLATLVAILLGQPRPLRELRADAPAPLVRAIERALRKDPRARWPSADDFAAALADDPFPIRDTATIARGEQRLIALLLARDADRVHVEAAIEAHHAAAVAIAGGSILGLFGVEATTGNELERAVRAALRARPHAARIAVAAGRISSGNHGVEGTALEAARACLAADVEGIAVSTEVARAFPELPLERRSDDIYELRAIAPDAWRRPERAGALVGRDAELARLRAAIEESFGAERASWLWIGGPPGIGKSRLCAAAAEGIDAQRLVARAGAFGAELALFTDLLERTAESLGVEHEARPRALARLAYSLPQDVDRCADAFARLLGGGGGDDDLQATADRLIVALLEWVLALAAVRPVLLVLEDLQWASEGALALVERLVALASDRPLAVLATARSELAHARPDLVARPEVIHLELRGLDLASTHSLAERAAGRPITASTLQSIHARSEGNPLFIEQFARVLDDERDGDLPIPHTVESALQARLDRLPAPERELCRRASVLGPTWTAEDLDALGTPDAHAALRSLRTRGIAVPRGRDRFELCSQLLAECAYRTMTEEVRRALHSRAAEHLAAIAGAEPERIARHYEQAGGVEAAARWYVTAVEAARARGDARAVLRSSDAAARLGYPNEHHYAVRMARADALRFLGRPREREAEIVAALADAPNDAERARCHSELCVHAVRGAQFDRALAHARDALDAAEVSGDPNARTLAAGRAMLAHLARGRIAEAATLLEQAGRSVAAATPAVRAIYLEWRGQLAAASGDLQTRREAFAEAAAMHRELGDLRRAAGAECNFADVDNRVGDYGAALRALTSARLACRKIGHDTMEGYASLNLGYAFTARGELEAAQDALDAAEAIAARVGEVSLALLTRLYRARALTAAARFVEAGVLAQSCVSESDERGLRAVAVRARVALADARLALGELASAREIAERAYGDLLALGGLEEDELEVYAVLARVAEADGDIARVHEVVSRGRARLDQLADALTDPALRASFLERVPANRDIVSRAQRAR